MSTSAEPSDRHCFVCGGGWIEREVSVKPRTERLLAISIIWFFAAGSGVAGWYVNAEEPFFPPFSLIVVGAAIVPQIVLLVMAIWFAFSEEPRKAKILIGNPDHDLRKLY